MFNKVIVRYGLFVLVVGSACGLSPAGGGTEDGRPAATAEPTEAAPMIPVSINEGLASLDSYRMTYTSDVYDSFTMERTVSTNEVARNRDTDASLNRTETRVTSDEAGLVSEEVQEQVVIGDQLCSTTNGEGELTTISETARVLSDLMSQVVVFHPLIENPVFVGEDMVGGVPVRSYTFELRSVGSALEVEASRAEGSYAIAVDGDFLVRYRLDMELRTGTEEDPEAEYSEFHIELSLEEINEPVDIAFPPSCTGSDSPG